MTPTLALIFCSAFVIYLVAVESRKRSGYSLALWIPLVWMMILGSRMVGLWFSSGSEKIGLSPDAYLDGSAFDRNIFIILIILSLIVLFYRQISWSTLLRKNAWLLIFIIYCGISIIWSDYPYISLKRYVKALGNLFMVLIVLTDASPREAVRSIFRQCAFVLIPYSIMLIKYFPTLGRVYHRYSGELSITGVTTNKNALGILCLVTGLILLWDITNTWRNRAVRMDKKEMLINVTILSMIIWLLIESDSKTSLICFIIGCTIIYRMEKQRVKRYVGYIGSYTLTAVVLFLLLQFSFDIWTVIITSLGRDATLTGRTELWGDLKHMVVNPLFGTGYDSFWLGNRMEYLWDKYWWRPTEAHNGYIETYVELGLIGLVLLTGVILSAFNNIKKSLSTDYDFGKIRMAIFVTALIYNITETGIKGLHLMWFCFLLVILEYSLNMKTSKVKQTY